jgi:disulfide bond formation protein DsbB
MSLIKDHESPLTVMLDRVILWLMLLVLAGVLTAAMAIQFVDRDIPCPLCLLERVAMFGCCFGTQPRLATRGGNRPSFLGAASSDFRATDLA